jgi:hypothetical protein
LNRRLDQEEQQLGTALRQLQQTSFNCEADACKAASTFADRLPYHKLTDVRIIVSRKYGKRGRPAQAAAPAQAYHIAAKLCRNEAAIAEACQRAGGQQCAGSGALQQ